MSSSYRNAIYIYNFVPIYSLEYMTFDKSRLLNKIEHVINIKNINPTNIKGKKEILENIKIVPAKNIAKDIAKNNG